MLAAPGERIMAPSTTSDTNKETKLGHREITGGAFWDYYEDEWGTSMAAPHVSGAISLMREANSELSKADIIEILQLTADTSGNPKKYEIGWGWLNIAEALKMAKQRAGA